MMRFRIESETGCEKVFSETKKKCFTGQCKNFAKDCEIFTIVVFLFLKIF